MDNAAKLAKVSEPFTVQRTHSRDRGFLDLICYRYEFKLNFLDSDAFLFPAENKNAGRCSSELSRSD
jgi:hypothetical protein